MYSDYKNPLYLITSSNSSGILSGRIISWIIPANLNSKKEEYFICLSNKGKTYEDLIKSKKIALHKLSVNNLSLVYIFGYHKSDNYNKFQDLNFELVMNLPIITDVANISIFESIEIFRDKSRSLFKISKIKSIRESKSSKAVSIEDFYKRGPKDEVKQLKSKYEIDIKSESE